LTIGNSRRICELCFGAGPQRDLDTGTGPFASTVSISKVAPPASGQFGRGLRPRRIPHRAAILVESPRDTAQARRSASLTCDL